MLNTDKIALTSCYGCGVCAVACPKDAINIKLSEEGFWTPQIDAKKCVDCGICNKVCAYIDRENRFETQEQQPAATSPKAYAITHKDSELRKVSTSGGAGFAIAEVLHKQGYKLCGVRYNNQTHQAEHFTTDSLEEYKQSINSKYIPSYTVDGFKELMNGDKYAVFGTPCQIDSLKRWAKLKNKLDNFVFVDLFCHGVPSYLHWNAYIKHNIVGNEKLLKPIFRDKRNGWHNYTMTLVTDKRTISKKLTQNDLFQNLFLGNYTLNKCCYKCVYRGADSFADLRLGDLWGRKYQKEQQGITGILSFCKMGDKIIYALAESCDITQESFDTVMAGQLKHDLPVPKTREKLLAGMKKDDNLKHLFFINAQKMWLKNFVPQFIKDKIKLLIRK